MVIALLSSLPALGDSSCDRIRFQCAVKGDKVATLCQGDAGWVYRFGAPGQVELEAASTEPGRDFELSRSRGEGDKERVVTSFWNEGHRYALIADRHEDQFEGRIAIYKAAEQLAVLKCEGPLSADLTELDGVLEGDPALLTAWVGSWHTAHASFDLVPDGDGLQMADGLATWTGVMPGAIHLGEAEGALERVTEDTYRLVEGCRITLKRTGPDRLEVVDHDGCGGANVTFSGTYQR